MAATSSAADSRTAERVSAEQKVKIRNRVKEWVVSVCDDVSETDPRYAFKEVICSGSVAEDVKVGLPNEYDFLLVLEGEFTVEEDPAHPPGYFGISQGGRALVPLKVRKDFYLSLKRVMEKRELLHETKYSNPVSLEIHMHAAAVTVHISEDIFDTGVWTRVDIDLVLAFRFQNSDMVPAWKLPIVDKLQKFLEAGLKEGFCVPGLEALPGTDVCFVPKNKLRGTNRYAWRISFSLHEQLLLINLTQQQADAYKLMKVILEDGKRHLKDLYSRELHDSLSIHVFSTYTIKTVLLHCYWKTRSLDLTEEQITSALLTYLISSVRVSSLSHFFITAADFFRDTRELHGSEMDHMLAFLEDTLQRLPDNFTSLKEKTALRFGVISGLLPHLPPKTV